MDIPGFNRIKSKPRFSNTSEAINEFLMALNDTNPLPRLAEMGWKEEDGWSHKQCPGLVIHCSLSRKYEIVITRWKQ